MRGRFLGRRSPLVLVFMLVGATTPPVNGEVRSCSGVATALPALTLD